MVEDGQGFMALLICRTQGWTCAVPVAQVRETMRPQAITRMPDAPGHVLGMAVIRGMATPVLDMGVLLGGAPVQAGRFILMTVQAQGTQPEQPPQRLALAVEQVEGIRAVPAAELQSLPSLLQGPAPSMVLATTRQDATLLMLLDSVRLMSLAQGQGGTASEPSA